MDPSERCVHTTCFSTEGAAESPTEYSSVHARSSEMGVAVALPETHKPFPRCPSEQRAE